VFLTKKNKDMVTEKMTNKQLEAELKTVKNVFENESIKRKIDIQNELTFSQNWNFKNATS
jgi:hypothetical protein